jgi:hypothetical protein
MRKRAARDGVAGGNGAKILGLFFEICVMDFRFRN